MPPDSCNNTRFHAANTSRGQKLGFEAGCNAALTNIRSQEYVLFLFWFVDIIASLNEPMEMQMSGGQRNFDLGGPNPPRMAPRAVDFLLGLQPAEMANQQATNVANGLMRRLGISVPIRPQHVSLWPLGRRSEFSNLDLAAIKEQLSSVFFEPFLLEFDEIMSFGGKEGNLAVVLCCSQRNAPLFELYDKIVDAQRQPGLEGGSIPAWTPHMTLFYSNREIIRQQLKPSVRWLVRDFHMIWSHIGECRHENLWQWPPSQ